MSSVTGTATTLEAPVARPRKSSLGIFAKKSGTALGAVGGRFTALGGNRIGLFSGGANAAERRSTLRSLRNFAKRGQFPPASMRWKFRRHCG